jgi:predicted MPP superfamily phosphohydrolase
MIFVLALCTLVGHSFLWIGLVNRLHAVGLPRRLIKSFTKVIFLALLAGPLVFLAWWLAGGKNPFANPNASIMHLLGRVALAIYIGACWLAGVVTLMRWLWHNLYFRRPPKLLRSTERRSAEISLEHAALHPAESASHFTVNLPGNEIMKLEITQMMIDVPRLPPALDGLTILHLSDFHFTGHIGKAYFREVARVSNELKPDLIALTGDYADKNVCIDWVPDTLGRLAAPHGVYYVMGNHDVCIDTQRLRQAMNDCGLIDLGGKWLKIPIRGESIILAGNELPWIAPAADFQSCEPSSSQGGLVRIVLSHSPDQIGWARSNEVDLMLCGHTHGGQIRFPILGALLMPSLYGVKFDCGLFNLPPTILHVTRGVSGEKTLRWNCPPEIVLLTLHAQRK